MLIELFAALSELVEKFGYIGIFVMTFVESTFVPIPSEITLIPAGYLIENGKLSFSLVLITSIIGTILGSLFNYYIAYHYGRTLLVKYGKYFFMDEGKLNTIEFFFQRHGAISTFSGRLLPGLKHFISFPAGLAKMDLKIFCIYTGLGAAIWSFLLLCVGYFIGTNEENFSDYLKIINWSLIGFIVFIGLFYYLKHRKT